jgi:hypothetical protein
MATGTRGRQGGQGNQGKQQGGQGGQITQGNQDKGIPTGSAQDGRGRVTDPSTDKRVGPNQSPAQQGNNGQGQGQQPERTDDLQETLGQGGQGGQDGQQQAPQAPQGNGQQSNAQQGNEQQGQQDGASIQQQQLNDPRMFAASKIMENAIQMLAVAGRMFKELDTESGVVQDGSDNVEYAQGCYDGLQQAIAEQMQSLDDERNQG